MKKVLALMIALVMLLLCACGEEAAPAQTEQGTAETQLEQTAETTAEGYYVQEKTLEDGTKVTIYRNGGPEGAIVKGFCTYTDGTTSEERYDSEGNLEYIIWNELDGSVHEQYHYPSGNIEKTISNFADGSYDEVHFLDNATYDEATGLHYDGTITYLKHITADGQVEEIIYDIEEDGTRWDTEEWDDGTIVRSHYGARGALIEQIQDNEKTGDHTELTYYENGNEKTRDSYHAEQKMRSHIEYYEDGSVKYALDEHDDGHKREEKINEAGYTTYYFESGIDMEFFANDTGELVKYVNAGKVYEGNAIPSDARDTFNRVRKVPAEDVSTIQGADGSSSTTTTFADGSVTTNSVAADGSATYESVSADGSESIEEYYPNGQLKRVFSKNGETSQEMHYDEDGYWTYFHQVVPGYELEITCDETGKVNKVLVNGQEQTDIESIVKDMFFRSW